jgi:hypothetical protein
MRAPNLSQNLIKHNPSGIQVQLEMVSRSLSTRNLHRTGIVRPLSAARQQFPANGRKSNCTSVQRFCSFIWASRPRCELTNSKISTLRFCYVWHAGCSYSNDCRTPHGSAAIALRGTSETCVRDSRERHSSGRSGCREEAAVSYPHSSARKDFGRCGEARTIGRGPSPSSAVEGGPS